MATALYLAGRSSDRPNRSWIWQGGIGCLLLAATVAVAANADSFGFAPLDITLPSKDEEATQTTVRRPSLFELAAAHDRGTDGTARHGAAQGLLAGAGGAASRLQLHAIQHALLIEGWPGEGGEAIDAAYRTAENDDLGLTDPHGRESGATQADWGAAGWNLRGLSGGFGTPASFGAAPSGPSGRRDGPVTSLDPDDQTIPLIDAPAVAAGPVPEPATWTMMLLAFGLTGAMVRRRRLPSR